MWIIKKGQNYFMIELVNITKTYLSNDIPVKILNGINLTISNNDFIAIIGKSGSGKSTLLNIISCIDNFDSGKLIIDGIDLKEYTEDQLSDFRNKYISIIFQSFNLIPYLTVIENVGLPLVYRKKNKKDRVFLSKKMLEEVGLKGKENSYPNKLSGGERQRLSIARALITNPKVIIADEPTGSLDSVNTKIVIDLFQKIHSKGIAIVLVTHDNNIASQCKKIITLSDGNINLK